MIHIKTDREIEIIKQAGRQLAHVKEVVRRHIKPGVTLLELDAIAEREMRQKPGMEPGFQRVYGYKWASCINVNQGLVHGIPTNRPIRPGDKVSVDMGIFYKGMNTDAAFTVAVHPVEDELTSFIEAGRTALERAIACAKPGNRIGHISQAIHTNLQKAGYEPSYMFTGHGVGKDLHEPPAIPCFFEGEIADTPLIRTGMVLAVEIIYAQGSSEAEVGKDGWTASLKDGTMGGLFEETVIVTGVGPQVATR